MFRVIRATDEFDDEYEEGYVEKKTYTVFGGYSGQSTNDPVEAIRLWFVIGQTHKMDTYISCIRKADAIKLCQAATEEVLTKFYNKYKCPYKLDYLIEAAKKQVANRCAGFYEKWGDQISPFCVG